MRALQSSLFMFIDRNESNKKHGEGTTRWIPFFLISFVLFRRGMQRSCPQSPYHIAALRWWRILFFLYFGAGSWSSFVMVFFSLHFSFFWLICIHMIWNQIQFWFGHWHMLRCLWPQRKCWRRFLLLFVITVIDPLAQLRVWSFRPNDIDNNVNQ